MVTYKKVSHINDVITYEYWPEGKFESGFVSYNTKTKEQKLVKIAPYDVGIGWYWGHMFSRIRRMEEEQDFRDEGWLCWY